MRSTLNSYLEDFLKRGDETAFADRRGLRVERWTYRRVAETARRFARELEARGIVHGERVIVWAANSAEWVAAFFGCLLRGVIVVPLDVESAPDFVARVRQQTQACLLLLSSETKGHGAGLGLPFLMLEELDDALSRRSSEPLEQPCIEGSDLVEIIYTSGTTAEPRGVCLTHRNLLANLAPLEEEIQKYLRWERVVHPVRFLNLLPLSHVFGQFMGLFVPQMLGGEVHFQASLNPSEIARTIKARRISVVVTVPRMLDTLREHVERREAAEGRGEGLRRKLAAAEGAHALRRLWTFRHVHRYFGWKFWAFVTGGATLDAGSETFWRRLGFALIQGYGMTETASLITVNHPFKTGRGSVGKVLPGQELKLGDGGEILVRGANVSPGYWRDSAAHPLDDAGWLRTGDLGEMDADGQIYFKGRRKEIIITAAGLNIHPEDIEAALNAQPEIKGSAVVAVEGARGPEPLAVLIMRDAQADPAQAVKRANQTLARHQRVRLWHVWPEGDFPRTPTQKVRKRDILERVKAEGVGVGRQGDGGTKDESGAVKSEPLINHHTALNTSLLGEAPARLGPSAKLATDLQLDSLGRVELLSALEDRYQIEIDEASFTEATTVGDIERIIKSGGETQDASPYPYPAWTQRFPATWFRLALFYAVVLPITSLLCWARVCGKDNLRGLHSQALFVSNHITYFDHALILRALPGRFRRRLAIAMEGERLRWWRRPPAGSPLHRRLRWLVQYFLTVLIFNTFSLPKSSGFRRSFAYAGETVDRGFSVLVFPEGVRAERVRLNPFKSGVGLLASELGVPVVPVRIDGLAELKVSGRRGFAFPGSVTINFGEPVSYSRDADAATITADLERRVKEL
ncbi:MAG TPA: AMP-binding protein [Pyrinomonadaceae bacterium]|jgi:long-chain acyl-CoA synthetase|nr:AMP-binding protein [Pyrinomonadaceae bacterium]